MPTAVLKAATEAGAASLLLSRRRRLSRERRKVTKGGAGRILRATAKNAIASFPLLAKTTSRKTPPWPLARRGAATPISAVNGISYFGLGLGCPPGRAGLTGETVGRGSRGQEGPSVPEGRYTFLVAAASLCVLVQGPTPSEAGRAAPAAEAPISPAGRTTALTAPTSATLTLTRQEGSIYSR